MSNAVVLFDPLTQLYEYWNNDEHGRIVRLAYITADYVHSSMGLDKWIKSLESCYGVKITNTVTYST